MTESNHGNLQAECQDQDGITSIRKKAWRLQTPLPSTSGNPPATNINSNLSTLEVPGSQQKTRGHSFQFQNTPTVQPIQNQPRNNYGANYGTSAPAQNTLPFAQDQNAHLGHVQHKGNYPIMVPIFCYPGCHQCQQFVNRHYY